MSAERILIIEDDPSIREVLEMLLQARGFQTITAENGETGLKRIEEKDPDLVLLDLTLPGMDGLEVCRRIREIPGKAKLPVIMLTARSEESDVVVGLEMGAVDYVTKPFNNQMLIARIRAQLRRTKELETASQPEKIFLAEDANEPEPEEEILSRAGWETVTAVQNKAILHLPNNELSRPTPRLADGAQMLFDFVYGETSGK